MTATTIPQDVTVERRWTSAQQAAIAARSRTLVAAAAGSGKTSVLTELVARSLAQGEVGPSEVCAVTFTEKAAQEMRGRIATRLAQLGATDALGQVELARIGTIHSLCSAILRMHGTAVGVDPGVQLLDEAQHAWMLHDQIVRVLEELADDSDVHRLRSCAGDDRIEATLRSVYTLAQQGDGSARIVSPEAIGAIVDPANGDAIVDAESAKSAIRAYHRLWDCLADGVDLRKRALGRISFDDLERLAVEAIRVPEVRADLRARWTMVLVDEFQDTNARQYELLDAIGGERLFMVGDEWQSIYRFRGADVDVFRARRNDSDGETTIVPMRENFRSDAPVLEVVNRVFGNERLFGERYEPVHPGTDAQRSVTAGAVELLIAPKDASATRIAEARRVAERIAELVECGEAEPGDIAVLYARSTGVDHYERAIRAWGLPVLRDASAGFYDQRDVRDVLALLALVRNHADDHAALQVIAGPLAGLEWEQLAQVADGAREHSCTLLQQVLRTDEGERAHDVIDAVNRLGEVAVRGTLVEIVASAVQLPAFELGAAQAADGVVRVANLRRLVELAASAEQVGVRDIAGFLEFVAAQGRDARVGEASIADEQSGAIRMMTVHAAKGLEFPHVFVIEAAAPERSGGSRGPAPQLDELGSVHVAPPAPDGKGARSPEHERLRDLDRAAEREEQLRLWYVAMTRARNRLYVSAERDFTLTKAGKPRNVQGALAWLRDVLLLPDDLGGGDGARYDALDDLVHVDTRAGDRAPRPIWEQVSSASTLAPALDLRFERGEAGAQKPADPDPHVLGGLLRAAVAEGQAAEWRQLAGTRLHDAIARLLDAACRGVRPEQLLDPEHGPWLTSSARERLEPIVSSAVFAGLVASGVRTEVPYVARSGSTVDSRAVPGAEVASTLADVDAGRIDALVVRPDGTWWIVDWKTTLPDDADTAFEAHADQLWRYAAVARAAGASKVVCSLVSIESPSRSTWHWQLDPHGLVSAVEQP